MSTIIDDIQHTLPQSLKFIRIGIRWKIFIDKRYQVEYQKFYINK
jgi:hypothetical protein